MLDGWAIAIGENQSALNKMFAFMAKTPGGEFVDFE